jgi:hypothetical protein
MKNTVLAVALAAAFGAPSYAFAADDQELAQIRTEIKQMKENYEARIKALEQRLQEVQAKTVAPSTEMQAKTAVPPTEVTASSSPSPSPEPASVSASAPPPVASAAATANAFNPAVSVILGGTYADLSQDPNKYRLQGFIPGGDIGPGKRGFNLGESELTLSANIDPQFAGQLTFALEPDNTFSIEEAFFQTLGLSNGLNLKAGRFLSSIGYLNSQHQHAWDFVDAPLAYQAFLGGQYKPDGVQLRWLAPTDRYFEAGLELSDSASFPGSDRNKNGFGSTSLFAHVGDDIGDSTSWRAGLSYLRTGSTDRTYADTDSTGTTVTNAFTGNSNIWIADAILKWAPNGNSTRTNFKLQGEYFRRTENGSLTYDTLAQSFGTATGDYSSAQSGWYMQGVYQFMPAWRVGLRYDKLYSGNADVGLINSGALSSTNFPQLASYNPSRSTLMFDYSPSEFSRFRIQFARDRSRPDATDNQIYFQYIMSLGVHGAHTF